MSHENRELILALQERGLDEAEIQQILAELKEYDQRTLHSSVFESIESGSFDILAKVREAASRND